MSHHPHEQTRETQRTGVLRSHCLNAPQPRLWASRDSRLAQRSIAGTVGAFFEKGTLEMR